jgi:hypothetical protein
MQIGPAIEPDKGIADDVLPDGKPPMRSRGTGIEHDSQHWPPALKSNLNSQSRRPSEGCGFRKHADVCDFGGLTISQFRPGIKSFWMAARRGAGSKAGQIRLSHQPRRQPKSGSRGDKKVSGFINAFIALICCKGCRYLRLQGLLHFMLRRTILVF